MSSLGIVIFGAAVRPDGTPSPTLARRVGYAIHMADEHPESLVLCSGAAGRTGPSEASVMAQLLGQAGVDPCRVHLDEESTDTFQSVVATAEFIRRQCLQRCVVCSDRYHLGRIRL